MGLSLRPLWTHLNQVLAFNPLKSITRVGDRLRKISTLRLKKPRHLKRTVLFKRKMTGHYTSSEAEILEQSDQKSKEIRNVMLANSNFK